MVNTVRVNADHGLDLHPLVDHVIKFKKFAKEEFQHLDCHFS